MVILNLDKPRELKFSHKAMRQFCALTQVSVPELREAVQRYDLMTTAVYCMLAVQDSSLTPNQVEDMLDELPVLEVYTKAVEAVSEALLDGLADGLTLDELSWEKTEWDEEYGMFVRRGTARCTAYFVATADEESAVLTDFILKGVMQ